MSETIPLSEPLIDGNEWEYVKECLDTGWVSSAGEYVDEFERKIADYAGVSHAVACVNGTSALHVSLRVAGVGAGDLVLAPTLTFIAPINAVSYLNADPIFFDCDDHLNINPDDVESFLRNNTYEKNGETFHEETDRCIAACLPVHILGNAADLEPIIELCRRKNIPVIEDASESLGTRYTEGGLSGEHTGTVGKIGCFSFNGNKIITTGGGGMIVTDDQSFAEKARYLTKQAKDDKSKYIHNSVGYNYRLTNLQAAMGVAQLEQLPGFLEKKQQIKNYYQDKLDELEEFEPLEGPDYSTNNNWLIPVRFTGDTEKKTAWTITSDLEQHGVGARPLWQLNHLQEPYYGCPTYNLEKVQKMHKRVLCVPSSVSLKKNEIGKVTAGLRNV